MDRTNSADLLKRLQHGHSLHLPSWGPYSKHYAGLSKILDDDSHSMIDFVPVIGYMRGKLIIPDVSFESGYHDWDALADLSYCAYRYELQWRDREYADVEFFASEATSTLAKMTFVNNTAFDREYVCTVFAVHRTRPHVELRLADGDRWVGAEQYSELLVAAGAGAVPVDLTRLPEQYARQGSDGLRRGVAVRDFLVHGMGLGNHPPEEYAQFQGKDRVADNDQFLGTPGTRIRYRLDPASPREFGGLHLRYAMAGVAQLVLEIDVAGTRTEAVLVSQTPARPIDFADLEMASIPLPGRARVDDLTIRVAGIDSAARQGPGR